MRVGEEEIQLAPKEFDLLWELLDHRGLVLTRDQLLERVWGYTFAGDTRTVDVHVRQLRRKLGDASPIVTVWGVGYKVTPARRTRRAPRGARCSVAALPPAGALPGGSRARRASSRPRSPFRLFQDHIRAQSLSELKREARGLTHLYRQQAIKSSNEGGSAPDFAAPELERATGTDSSTSGPDVFPGQTSGLEAAPESRSTSASILDGNVITFEFTPPGENRTFLAVGQPLGSSKPGRSAR